jgi:hypothetical protein
MTDIVADIADVLADIEDDNFVFDKEKIYILLSRAAGRIDSQARELKKLSDTVSDMGWQLNPDRMGGQFTEEEKNRTGWL